MDIVTQGILGASVAQSSAKKEHVRMACIIGLISGLLADADVLIRSSTDPLLTLEYHRHFTHSIFFIPFGAFIAFLLLWPFFRKRLSVKCLYLYCFMGYLLSGFIDACTSYGTHLFWPITDERTAWSVIPIVDPIFTITLFVAISVSFKTLKAVYARVGLLLAGSYLVFGLIQLNRAENVIHELAKERQHEIERIIVKPTVGNTILWRSVYLTDNHFYIDAVRVGLNRRVYEGTSIEKFDVDTAFPDIDKETTLYDDIKRFEVFSDGYVSFYPEKTDTLGDLRYSINPVSALPLWGIQINLRNPQDHVEYQFYRDVSKENRKPFMDMLWNMDVEK